LVLLLHFLSVVLIDLPYLYVTNFNCDDFNEIFKYLKHSIKGWKQYSLYFAQKNFNYEDDVFEFLYKKKKIIYIHEIGYILIHNNPDPSICMECNKKLQERCLKCRQIIWDYDERGENCTAKCKKCDILK
jgi:hypothetical protein